MKTLGSVVALAMLLGASPVAQSFAPQGLDRPAVGLDGRIHISAARAATLRECIARAARYPQYEWGNMESRGL